MFPCGDRFSGHAALYRQARPQYPLALFEWIAQAAPNTQCAWDVGCGSGQATLGLARHFERVYATDASKEQLRYAPAHPRVEYRCERAEASTLPSESQSAVVIAQAYHWLDLPAFWREVYRVTRPGALVVAVGYDLLRCTEEVQPLLISFYQRLAPYWPPERRYVEERYQSLPFLAEEIPAPTLLMRHEWKQDQLLAYLRSWSAVQRFIREHHYDPTHELGEALLQRGGGPNTYVVEWELFLRAGYLPG
jgi:ubiquinone/menaquinone biosynthesis C-methylase UbiE